MSGDRSSWVGRVGPVTDPIRCENRAVELTPASARFRNLLARHDVARISGGTTTVNHPTVGPMTLHRDKLPVDDVLLVVYYPDIGSDSAEKFGLLGAFRSAPG